MMSYINDDLTINHEKVKRDASVLSVINNKDIEECIKDIEKIADNEKYCYLLGMCHKVTPNRKFFDFRKVMHKDKMKVILIDGVGVIKNKNKNVGVFHDISQGYLIYSNGELKVWQYNE